MQRLIGRASVDRVGVPGHSRGSRYPRRSWSRVWASAQSIKSTSPLRLLAAVHRLDLSRSAAASKPDAGRPVQVAEGRLSRRPIRTGRWPDRNPASTTSIGPSWLTCCRWSWPVRSAIGRL